MLNQSLTFEQFKRQVNSIMDKQGYLFMLDDETAETQLKRDYEKGDTPKDCAGNFIGFEIEEEEENNLDDLCDDED